MSQEQLVDLIVALQDQATKEIKTAITLQGAGSDASNNHAIASITIGCLASALRTLLTPLK